MQNPPKEATLPKRNVLKENPPKEAILSCKVCKDTGDSVMLPSTTTRDLSLILSLGPTNSAALRPFKGVDLNLPPDGMDLNILEGFGVRDALPNSLLKAKGKDRMELERDDLMASNGSKILAIPTIRNDEESLDQIPCSSPGTLLIAQPLCAPLPDANQPDPWPDPTMANFRVDAEQFLPASYVEVS